MKKSVFLVFAPLLFSACAQMDCHDLVPDFKTYKEAIHKVRQAKFSLADTLGFTESEDLRKAYYYSCDGKTGYVIVTSDKNGAIIYNEVPTGLWKGLKNAESRQSYYDKNIRNRFLFLLSN